MTVNHYVNNIRLVNETEDLESIVDVHINAFPGFFLTLMGRRFIREYYKTVLEFSDNISLGLYKDGILVGFVVGFGNPVGFYSFYKKKRFKLLPLIIVSILRNPFLINRVLLNITRINSPNFLETDVELSSIGIISTLRGLGLGQALVKQFIESSMSLGYKSIILTTDSNNNYSVNKFYTQLGFILEKTFLSGERSMNFYRKKLSKSR